MYWYSPIPINKKLSDKLEYSNIYEIRDIKDTNDLILLIYNPPDVLIDYFVKENIENIENYLSVDFLINYYNDLNNIKLNNNLKLIAGWNLECLNFEDLNKFFNNRYENKDSKIKIPKIDKTISLITLEILRCQNNILNFYQDIELKALIMDRDIDLNIKFRIKNNLNNFDSLLSEQNNSYKMMDLNRELENKLSNSEKELDNLNRELENKLSNSEKELDNLKAYNQKLEEDLEIFYVKNKNLEELSNKQDILIKRASKVLQSITQINIRKLIKINNIVHDINHKSEKSKLPFLKKIKGNFG